MTTMYVTKSSEPKVKNNVALVDTQADVPEFLRGIVTVKNGDIYLKTTIEGKELCHVHSFIAWEPDASCEGGFNVWCKSNGHQTLYFYEGVWYERPTVVKYFKINWDAPSIPDFIEDDELIDIMEDRIVLHASNGDQTAMAGVPYAILGYEDGGVSLLKLDTYSAREYFVCSKEGRILEPLVK